VLNDYILGLLYGDGSYTVKEGREFFLFSTVHKELADRVMKSFNDNHIKYSHHVRSFEVGHEKENYGELELVEIYDKKLLSILGEKQFKSEHAEERIKLSNDFLRGFLETKGTLFQSNSRGSIFWRISFSGNEKDIHFLKESLERMLGIAISSVVQRREREELGIISKSYRINIQNREGVSKLVEYIEGEEVSTYLKERIEGFKLFDKITPFNMKKKVFKHHKFAVGFMAREMNLDLKGIRGISIKDRQKPVFLFENEEVKLCFRNWEQAYNWIREEYQEKTGKNPPKVESLQ